MYLDADFIDGFGAYIAGWVGTVFEDIYLPDSYTIRYARPPGGFAFDGIEL